MEGGKSSANSYWPGFVDALTNVVIAMIFVVVVLAISLSFAAQLMGKKLAEKYIKEHTDKVTATQPSATPPPAPVAAPTPQVAESNLRNTTRIPVAGNEKAASSAASQVRPLRNTVQLDFAPGALTLDTAAAERFREVAQGVRKDPSIRGVVVVASGPAMSMSDNQRAAFLRVMAVRNLLLEMGFSGDRIQTRIDTETEMSGPSVNVAFTE